MASFKFVCLIYLSLRAAPSGVAAAEAPIAPAAKAADRAHLSSELDLTHLNSEDYSASLPSGPPASAPPSTPPPPRAASNHTTPSAVDTAVCEPTLRQNYNYVLTPPEVQKNLRCSHFEWNVSNFSTLASEQVYSPIFRAVGYSWQILLFPHGNNAQNVSAYLSFLPSNCDLAVDFSLTIDNFVVNNSNNTALGINTSTVSFNASTTFTAEVFDWGWQSFLPIIAEGALTDDLMTIHVQIELQEAVCHVDGLPEKEQQFVFMEWDIESSLLPDEEGEANNKPNNHTYRHILVIEKEDGVVDALTNTTALELLLDANHHMLCLDHSTPWGLAWLPPASSDPRTHKASIQEELQWGSEAVNDTASATSTPGLPGAPGGTGSNTTGTAGVGSVVISYKKNGQPARVAVVIEGSFKLRSRDLLIGVIVDGMEIVTSAFHVLRKKKGRGRKCHASVRESGVMMASPNAGPIISLVKNRHVSKHLPETKIPEHPWHDYTFTSPPGATYGPDTIAVVSLISTEKQLDWNSDSKLHLYGSFAGIPWLTQFDMYADSVMPVLDVGGNVNFYQQVIAPRVPPQIGIGVWYGDWVEEWQKGEHHKLDYIIRAHIETVKRISTYPRVDMSVLPKPYQPHYYLVEVPPGSQLLVYMHASGLAFIMHSPWDSYSYHEDIKVENSEQDMEGITSKQLLTVTNNGTDATHTVCVSVLTTGEEIVIYNLTVISTDANSSDHHLLRESFRNSLAKSPLSSSKLSSSFDIQDGVLTMPPVKPEPFKYLLAAAAVIASCSGLYFYNLKNLKTPLAEEHHTHARDRQSRNRNSRKAR